MIPVGAVRPDNWGGEVRRRSHTVAKYKEMLKAKLDISCIKKAKSSTQIKGQNEGQSLQKTCYKMFHKIRIDFVQTSLKR